MADRSPRAVSTHGQLPQDSYRACGSSFTGAVGVLARRAFAVEALSTLHLCAPSPPPRLRQHGANVHTIMMSYNTVVPSVQVTGGRIYDSVHAMPGCITRTPHAHTVLCLRVDKLVFSLRVLRCAQNSFARILRLAVRQTLPYMRRRWACQSYAPAVFKRDAGWVRGQS